MANSNFRVHDTPRISANELATFLVASFSERERIIQRNHWASKVLVIRYKAAKEAISSFLSSPTRDRRILASARSLLQATIDRSGASPFQKDDARASIEALDSFERGLNDFGLSSFTFDPAPQRASPLAIEGVEVTVSIDRIVTQRSPNSGNRVGGLLLRSAKGTDTETEGAASRRRQIGRNAAVLIHMWAEQNLASRGEPWAEACISVDVQHREAHRAPRTYARLSNDITSACRFIRGMWNVVPPPPGFSD